MVSSSDTPPHGLQLVIDFVNTRDLEAGTDELPDAPALARWLAAHGLHADASRSVRHGDHAEALALREALRGVLLAHNGGPADPAAAAILDRTAERGALGVRFTPDGATELAPRDPGFAGVLAGLLVPVALASADGAWGRVKACRDDACEWAFYDRSRNRSGRWCDMAVCGNRTKVRNYRSRRGD